MEEDSARIAIHAGKILAELCFVLRDHLCEPAVVEFLPELFEHLGPNRIKKLAKRVAMLPVAARLLDSGRDRIDNHGLRRPWPAKACLRSRSLRTANSLRHRLDHVFGRMRETRLLAVVGE